MQALQVEFYLIVYYFHRFSCPTISVPTVTSDGSQVAERSYSHRYLPEQAEAQKAAFRPSLPILCWLWVQSFSTAKQARQPGDIPHQAHGILSQELRLALQNPPANNHRLSHQGVLNLQFSVTHCLKTRIFQGSNFDIFLFLILKGNSSF